VLQSAIPSNHPSLKSFDTLVSVDPVYDTLGKQTPCANIIIYFPCFTPAFPLLMSALGKRKSVSESSQRPAKQMTPEETCSQVRNAAYEAHTAAREAVAAAEAGLAVVEGVGKRMAELARKAVDAMKAMREVLDEMGANDGETTAMSDTSNDGKAKQSDGGAECLDEREQNENSGDEKEETNKKEENLVVTCPRCGEKVIALDCPVFMCGNCNQFITIVKEADSNKQKN
jgi:ribosomal protein S27AE